MDKTTVCVLGDHCQIDMHTIVYLNKLFLDKGYLETDGEKITSYKAVCKEADGSAYIYLNPDYAENAAFKAELTELLNEIKEDEKFGIEAIFSSSEAKEMGADEKCFCMVEGKPGFYFLNEFSVLTEPVAETRNLKMMATHGCLNTKEENRTFFCLNGYGVKKGARRSEMRLIDEGPTLARLLGGSLPEADGNVLEEFLE